MIFSIAELKGISFLFELYFALYLSLRRAIRRVFPSESLPLPGTKKEDLLLLSYSSCLNFFLAILRTKVEVSVFLGRFFVFRFFIAVLSAITPNAG